MPRLNEKELDARIQKFLFRKNAQFPELEGTWSRTSRSWHDTQTEDTYKKTSSVRWRLQLS